jgi:hypothetical protein
VLDHPNHLLTDYPLCWISIHHINQSTNELVCEAILGAWKRLRNDLLEGDVIFQHGTFTVHHMTQLIPVLLDLCKMINYVGSFCGSGRIDHLRQVCIDEGILGLVLGM